MLSCSLRYISTLSLFINTGTILRRWKKNWFDLWSDGRLTFYDDQQRRDMEDEIHMKVDCINIRNASACRGRAWTMALQDARINTVVAPPQFGFAQEVVASAPPSYAELNPTPQVYYPDQYGGYVPQPPPPYTSHVVYSAGGQLYTYASPYQYPVNHVVIEDRRRDDAGDMALGMLAGAATGLAIGSLFSVF
uniref:Pleckstrin homology domain containing, family B (evectins) member 2 n=1 Tax=Astyanax mexicanus TaxID=7994 RepID=A0A3B1KIT8_ASTMX